MYLYYLFYFDEFEIFAHSSSFHVSFRTILQQFFHNIFLSYFHFVAFTKIREIFVTLFIISVLLKIFHERMIKDSVKNDDEGGISTCALLQIFPAPFTETRYPRFIFGPPYRSQRRPATCCSILSPACWALPFCQLARFRGLPFVHSSQREDVVETAFSIPLSSTPIFFPSFLLFLRYALFLPRRINHFWGGNIFYDFFPRLT